MHFGKILILLFIFTAVMLGQNKNFTIEDVVINSYSSLAAERLSQISWVPNTNYLAYVEDSVLVKINAENGSKDYLISLRDINSSDIVGKELQKYPKLNWISENGVSFWNEENLFSINLDTKDIQLLNSAAENCENKNIAPNNLYAAFTLDNNLYVALEQGKIVQITDEEDKGIVSGQSVSRNEFGIKGGIFWSPKSNFIAFYQKDEREVTNYPLVEIGTAPAKVNNTKYPMAGQTSEIVKIGIYNFEKKSTIWLKTEGPADQYLTNVTWDPSEKFIYAAHLNRDQDHLKLFKYYAESGEQVKLLFEERDEEYVEPEHNLKFMLKDKNNFIWFSERDGWMHLYLYDTEGNLIKQITSGDWLVKELVGVNKKTEDIYFISTKNSPIEDHLYKVNLKSGKLKRISMKDQNHRINYNNFSDNFIDTYCSMGVPSVTQIIDSDGNIIGEVKRSKNPIDEFNVSKPKIFTLKGENNVDLYSRLILPTDFDSTKLYPAIVYVYGGPHDQMVTNEWYYGRYDFWFQYMAQRGFIIFTLDNRGSANRGLEFEQAIFGKLGTVEIKDQMVGVEYLKSLPYVDKDRIGVYGWSYGGFMTTSLMLRTNDIFKVGVGGGTVIDWKLYEVMYGERYMDTPETNLEGYAESNLLNYVENLNGKLLLVHGTSDPTVVWENTLEFAKKAANLNKPLDYYPYVGHGHGVKGKDAIHLYEKISQYFIDNL